MHSALVFLDEVQHALPGVRARFLVLREPAGEEDIRRARIDDGKVLLSPCCQSLIEGIYRGLWDARVRTAKEAEERGGKLVHAFDRRRGSVPRWADRPPVEADRARETETVRRLQP